jgi:hypothetical protein
MIKVILVTLLLNPANHSSFSLTTTSMYVKGVTADQQLTMCHQIATLKTLLSDGNIITSCIQQQEL